MTAFADADEADRRFDEVFEHLGAIVSYARRRGAKDPEAVAAEVMTIAWNRLPDVPHGDPRPWLMSTARNLVFTEWRHSERERAAFGRVGIEDVQAPPVLPVGLDPDLEAALRSLSLVDREALLLIAWEALTPTEAASSLGISPVTFRVRLHRARRRLRAALPEMQSSHPSTSPTVRSTHV